MIVLLCLEIPEWLIVFSKAPHEHDHKLKVHLFLSVLNNGKQFFFIITFLKFSVILILK